MSRSEKIKLFSHHVINNNITVIRTSTAAPATHRTIAMLTYKDSLLNYKSTYRTTTVYVHTVLATYHIMCSCFDQHTVVLYVLTVIPSLTRLTQYASTDRNQ